MENTARGLTERFPRHGMGWKALGMSLMRQGRSADALEPLQKAAELLPGDFDTHFDLGLTLKGQGHLAEAEASYRRVLEKQPDYAEAHFNLANILHEQGRHAEAEAGYRRALKIKPVYSEAHCHLGNTLQDQGRLAEAEASLRRALEIKPDNAVAHYNLGNIFIEQGRIAEARASYLRALEIKPDYAEAHTNLGNILRNQGLLHEAEACYRRAKEIKPDLAIAYSNLLFTLNFYSDKCGEEIFAVCGEYDKLFCLPHRGEWQTHSNSRESKRRLRVGYISPDFRNHAVAFFAEPILANHDKSQVEIFCYAEVKREDEYTERFRRMGDHWHSTVGMSNEAAAQMIREHQIDILVDLAGHTAENRLLILARKPAPIQITYLGYPGTTGLSAMDYRITDHYADPEGIADTFYSERLLRLPGSLWCYRPSADMSETSPLPALSRGYLTFGSFNNFNKVDQDTLELWAELLRALPNSRLMMLTVPEGEARLRLASRFAELGISAQRLEFYGKLPGAEFRRKFLEVDITLDPVTVNGATTTCESLWMGVPVMSLAGDHFLTRAGLSILSTAGLSDFVASSREDYIRIATHLADNLHLLAEIRDGLREHLSASPLVDEAGFTRNLEALYRKIWADWCSAT
jgi:predicted O-linked N-acetylglucosamine transferase (SPINDLY family)